MDGANTEEQGIPLEDANLAIEIFVKALSYRPQIQRAASGEHFGALSLLQIVTETLQPRIMVLSLGPNGMLPCLFSRFVGDESPVVEAIFYPIEAILSFLADSRSYISLLNLTERTEEERKQWLASGLSRKR